MAVVGPPGSNCCNTLHSHCVLKMPQNPNRHPSICTYFILSRMCRPMRDFLVVSFRLLMYLYLKCWCHENCRLSVINIFLFALHVAAFYALPSYATMLFWSSCLPSGTRIFLILLYSSLLNCDGILFIHDWTVFWYVSVGLHVSYLVLCKPL